MPVTLPATARKLSGRTRLFAALATAALVGGVLQLLPSAGADSVVVTQVSSSTDSGAIDMNRDGIADYAAYGVTNSALSVGEQPRDGSDLRLFLPFTVSQTALDAMGDGGNANVSMRVWRADNLTTQRLVVDAYTNGTVAKRADYNRAATRLVTLTPVEGRVAVDVSSVLRTMSGPGTVTLRLSLDRLAPVDKKLTQVNIATSESRDRANRPVLTVSSPGASGSTGVVPTVPSTPTPAPTEPTTTTTTQPEPPVSQPAPPATPGAGQPPAAVTAGRTWNTVFDDEFDGSSVDASHWNVQDNSNYGSGNNEDECYKAANTTVGNGMLSLTGKRETVSTCGSNPDGGNNYYFTSGMVTTRQQGGGLKFKFRQGYAEVRMRVPRGNLYWPAFWLVGAGDGSSPGWPDYGEIDVTEIYGAKPDISESNFHRAGGNIGARNHNVKNLLSNLASISVNPPNPLVAGGTNDWHTYGINWTANRLDWYIDGVLVRTYNASSSADTSALSYEHSIILNLAMGGNGPASSDHGYTGHESGNGYDNGNLQADLPGSMDVDYVRVWQG